MRIITTILIFFFSLTASSAQSQKPALEIKRLTGNFYIYTTYNSYKGQAVPANGMYVVTATGVVLFDTPWDTTQFQPLLDRILLKHRKHVVTCIATHFHADRTAGLEYYRTKGIKTYTTILTDSFCKSRGEKRAEYLMSKDTIFQEGQYRFQTYYAGAGHSPDNIVIWFEKEKILYGGCLVKSAKAEDLGNLSDANVRQWPATIKNIQRNCPNPKFIIPGHGDWRNNNSLTHTLALAQQNE